MFFSVPGVKKIYYSKFFRIFPGCFFTIFPDFSGFFPDVFYDFFRIFLRKNGLEYGITSETTETRDPRVRRRKPGIQE